MIPDTLGRYIDAMGHEDLHLATSWAVDTMTPDELRTTLKVLAGMTLSGALRAPPTDKLPQGEAQTILVAIRQYVGRWP